MTKKVLSVLFWLAILLCALADHVHFQQFSEEKVYFGNQYVRAWFNPSSNQLLGLYGDFEGNGNFTKNVLSKPFHLIAGGSRSLLKPTASSPVSSVITPLKDKVTVINKVSLESVDEEWSFVVSVGSRVIELAVTGRTVQEISATYLSYGMYTNAPALYGLFDSGVVQMKDRSAACLGSEERLHRAYFLGDRSALEIVFPTAEHHPNTTIFRSDVSSKDGYRSGMELQVAGSRYPQLDKRYFAAWSSLCWNAVKPTVIPKDTIWALELHLLPNDGDFPTYSIRNVMDSQNLGGFQNLRTHLLGIYPSAVGCLQSYYANQSGIVAPTISHPDVGYSPDTNFFDPDNFMTMSAMLYSGDSYLAAQVRKVLERTASTMCGLGSNQDPVYCGKQRQRLLSKQQPFHAMRHKRLSQTENSHMSSPTHSPMHYEAQSRSGQLMHHYVSLAPTYESIAGSEQLGPNIFWTLTALRYLSLTQDRDFAVEYFPYIDLSVKFILSFVDVDMKLVAAPGPLWIDVLVRENYTSDSSAMLLLFLPQLAEYYDLMHQLSSGNQNLSSNQSKSLLYGDMSDMAHELRALTQEMTSALRDTLWDGNDHFVTQINPDGTSRDFVDYDANLLAIAAGVFQPIDDKDDAKELAEKLKRLVTRVDSGANTHIRATWCSEKPYTGDRCDCYIVGGSVCGDSVVTLARIGWADALARHLMRDTSTYFDKILQPLQQDLLTNTWLYERYDAQGNMIRTSYYFEYPALVTMLLREVTFGIAVSPSAVIIDPLVLANNNGDSSSLLYSVGSDAVGAGDSNDSGETPLLSSRVRVDLRGVPQQLSLQFPGVAQSAWARTCRVYALLPLTAYTITASSSISSISSTVQMTEQTNSQGVLSFTATFASDTIFTIAVLPVS
jgi:hypothetical protein